MINLGYWKEFLLSSKCLADRRILIRVDKVISITPNPDGTSVWVEFAGDTGHNLDISYDELVKYIREALERA